MLILLTPTDVKVPGALNVSVPAGTEPAPKTPIFEVPIAMI